MNPIKALRRDIKNIFFAEKRKQLSKALIHFILEDAPSLITDPTKLQVLLFEWDRPFDFTYVGMVHPSFVHHNFILDHKTIEVDGDEDVKQLEALFRKNNFKGEYFDEGLDHEDGEEEFLFEEEWPELERELFMECWQYAKAQTQTTYHCLFLEHDHSKGFDADTGNELDCHEPESYFVDQGFQIDKLWPPRYDQFLEEDIRAKLLAPKLEKLTTELIHFIHHTAPKLVVNPEYLKVLQIVWKKPFDFHYTLSPFPEIIHEKFWRTRAEIRCDSSNDADLIEQLFEQYDFALEPNSEDGDRRHRETKDIFVTSLHFEELEQAFLQKAWQAAKQAVRVDYRCFFLDDDEPYFAYDLDQGKEVAVDRIIEILEEEKFDFVKLQ